MVLPRCDMNSPGRLMRGTLSAKTMVSLYITAFGAGQQHEAASEAAGERRIGQISGKIRWVDLFRRPGRKIWRIAPRAARSRLFWGDRYPLLGEGFAVDAKMQSRRA
jgi:hypothetical protein